MKISIVIPVFNVENYITDCLRSVISQTYADIECILVDDCGTDNSILIAENIISNYNGTIEFIILRKGINGGLSEARNAGIRAASGDYLYFLDSDDEITPDAISYLTSKAIAGNYDLIACEFVNSWSELMPSEVYKEEIYKGEKVILGLKKQNNAWNRLIKRELILSKELFFMPNIYHEDRLWSFWVNQNISSSFWSNKKTYIYRVRPNSILTDKTKQLKRIMDSSIIVRNMESVYSSKSLSSFQNSITFNYIESERYGVCISAFRLNEKTAFAVFKQLSRKFTVSEIAVLSASNFLKFPCWILNVPFGFIYLKLFYKGYYINKKI